MELLEGETLSERARRGPLAIDDLLDLGIQLAESWILYVQEKYDEVARKVREVIVRKPDAEGAW